MMQIFNMLCKKATFSVVFLKFLIQQNVPQKVNIISVF